MKNLNKSLFFVILTIGFLFNTIAFGEYDNDISESGSNYLENMLYKYDKDSKVKGYTGIINNINKEKDFFKNKEYSKVSQSLKTELLDNSLGKIKRKNLKNNMPLDLKNNSKIFNNLVNSMKNDQKKSYKFLIKTTLTIEELKTTINFFDNAEIKYLSNDGIKNIYEILLPYSGKISKIIGNGIESGDIPEELLPNIEIVNPYVVKLNVDNAYLTGELLPNIWGITKIGAQNYQKGLISKTKVKIGVIDTGIDYKNPDLSSNIFTNSGEILNGIDDDNNGYIDDIKGYNFISKSTNSLDDNGHGTHVSGILGGVVNGKGIFGVNSNSYLVPLKVLDANGYGSSYAIIDAINYSVNNGIKVLNLSLGGDGNPSNDILCNAITNAKSKGVITVVAAGNENSDVSTKVPAGCSDAITVGAVDSSLKKSSFSNYGLEVDVSAPGVNIYSTVLNNGFSSWNGTSMATPFVSGLVSAILSYNSSASYDNIMQIIKTNSDVINSSVNIGNFINMTKVMLSLGVLEDVSDTTLSPGTSSGNILPPSTSSGTTSSGNILPPSTSSGITSSGSILPPSTSSGTTSSGNILPPTTSSGITTPIVTNSLPIITYTVGYYSSRNNQLLINCKDLDGKIIKTNFYLNGKILSTYNSNINNINFSYIYKKGSVFNFKVITTDDKKGISEKIIYIK